MQPIAAATPFEQTAAGRMTTRIPIVHTGDTLAEVHALFWKQMNDFDTVKHVFVTDKKGILLGMLASRDLFRFHQWSLIDEVMIPYEGVLSVLPTDDQETAVQKAVTHNAESVAVVDKSGKLLGALSSKELMKILQDETQEDLAEEGRYDMSPKLDSILDIPIWESVKNRGPWIGIGLLGGIGSAFVIGHFEELLAHHLILAAFIPMVVYISGAVSAQLQMYFVRDLALYPSIPYVRYATRQGAVVAIIAAVLGVALLGIGLGIKHIGMEAYVIALGTGISILTAIVTGIFVPWALSKFITDPANATAPVATVISDGTTILVFFAVAQLLLG